jgi:hypothetical protein
MVSCVAWAGNTVGYAQATGYFKKDSRPTLYQPLNLLDARDITAWCTETADPLNDVLTFGFNSPVTIDELKINNGNNFSEEVWKSFARAKKVTLKSGKESRVLNVEDKRGSQSFSVSPPLKGTRFSIEVLDAYDAEENLDASVCLTDVVFMQEGKPLNGPWLTTQLKYDKGTQYVMGTWFAGYDGTPDYFLSFNYDGTYRWSYEPFDNKTNKAEVMTGRYDVSGSRLMFELAGKKHSVSYKKEAGKLTFDGELPESLKKAWRAQP